MSSNKSKLVEPLLLSISREDIEFLANKTHLVKSIKKFTFGIESFHLEKLLQSLPLNDTAKIQALVSKIQKSKKRQEIITLLKKSGIIIDDLTSRQLHAENQLRIVFNKKIESLKKVIQELVALNKKKNPTEKEFRKLNNNQNRLSEVLNYLQDNWVTMIKYFSGMHNIGNNIESLIDKFFDMSKKGLDIVKDVNNIITDTKSKNDKAQIEETETLFFKKAKEEKLGEEEAIRKLSEIVLPSRKQHSTFPESLIHSVRMVLDYPDSFSLNDDELAAIKRIHESPRWYDFLSVMSMNTPKQEQDFVGRFLAQDKIFNEDVMPAPITSASVISIDPPFLSAGKPILSPRTLSNEEQIEIRELNAKYTKELAEEKKYQEIARKNLDKISNAPSVSPVPIGLVSAVAMVLQFPDLVNLTEDEANELRELKKSSNWPQFASMVGLKSKEEEGRFIAQFVEKTNSIQQNAVELGPVVLDDPDFSTPLYHSAPTAPVYKQVSLAPDEFKPIPDLSYTEAAELKSRYKVWKTQGEQEELAKLKAMKDLDKIKLPSRKVVEAKAFSIALISSVGMAFEYPQVTLSEEEITELNEIRNASRLSELFPMINITTKEAEQKFMALFFPGIVSTEAFSSQQPLISDSILNGGESSSIPAVSEFEAPQSVEDAVVPHVELKDAGINVAQSDLKAEITIPIEKEVIAQTPSISANDRIISIPQDLTMQESLSTMAYQDTFPAPILSMSDNSKKAYIWDMINSKLEAQVRKKNWDNWEVVRQLAKTSRRDWPNYLSNLSLNAFELANVLRDSPEEWRKEIVSDLGMNLYLIARDVQSVNDLSRLIKVLPAENQKEFLDQITPTHLIRMIRDNIVDLRYFLQLIAALDWERYQYKLGKDYLQEIILSPVSLDFLTKGLSLPQARNFASGLDFSEPQPNLDAEDTFMDEPSSRLSRSSSVSVASDASGLPDSSSVMAMRDHLDPNTYATTEDDELSDEESLSNESDYSVDSLDIQLETSAPEDLKPNDVINNLLVGLEVKVRDLDYKLRQNKNNRSEWREQLIEEKNLFTKVIDGVQKYKNDHEKVSLILDEVLKSQSFSKEKKVISFLFKGPTVADFFKEYKKELNEAVKLEQNPSPRNNRGIVS